MKPDRPGLVGSRTTESLLVSELRLRLSELFREQRRFADGYSPLYAQLFDVVAGWLAGQEAETIVAWLLDAATGRRPFDVTLLLPAALHRDVLAGVPAAAPLAQFYPTAGGLVPEPEADGAPSDQLVTSLRHLIHARADALASFIGRANVQTNESARGLAWLLPVSLLRWPAVHLVELGASAGLNLVAERRGYVLADADDPGTPLLKLGGAHAPQFKSLVAGRQSGPEVASIDIPGFATLPTPVVLSRTGGDLFPFPLQSREDELTLASFVWGDQPQRLERLWEGIDALHAVEQSVAPVRVLPMRLPDDLPGFLERFTPADAPVVLFNTTVTMYLPAQGTELDDLIAQWAMRRRQPVLWLQWELPRPSAAAPPRPDWLPWTVDLWQTTQGRTAHQRWQIAWVHPHGSTLQWTPEMNAFLRTAMQN